MLQPYKWLRGERDLPELPYINPRPMDESSLDIMASDNASYIDYYKDWWSQQLVKMEIPW